MQEIKKILIYIAWHEYKIYFLWINFKCNYIKGAEILYDK